jgi:hypothetical protein
MLTERVRSRVTRPCPLHLPHGSEMTSPRPWHVGQVRSMEKNPDAARMRPDPLQVAQGLGEEPGFAPLPEQASQVMAVGTEISAFLPA